MTTFAEEYTDLEGAPDLAPRLKELVFARLGRDEAEKAALREQIAAVMAERDLLKKAADVALADCLALHDTIERIEATPDPTAILRDLVTLNLADEDAPRTLDALKDRADTWLGGEPAPAPTPAMADTIRAWAHQIIEGLGGARCTPQADSEEAHVKACTALCEQLCAFGAWWAARPAPVETQPQVAAAPGFTPVYWVAPHLAPITPAPERLRPAREVAHEHIMGGPGCLRWCSLDDDPVPPIHTMNCDAVTNLIEADRAARQPAPAGAAGTPTPDQCDPHGVLLQVATEETPESRAEWERQCHCGSSMKPHVRGGYSGCESWNHHCDSCHEASACTLVACGFATPADVERLRARARDAGLCGMLERGADLVARLASVNSAESMEPRVAALIAWARQAREALR